MAPDLCAQYLREQKKYESPIVNWQLPNKMYFDPLFDYQSVPTETSIEQIKKLLKGEK